MLIFSCAIKWSKHPGDSKEIVLAGTNFLNSGLYQPLAGSITDVISKLVIDNETFCMLDAGCGEEYYFDYLFHALNET
jgi:23S rRNA (guanine745-N1)-methyltransferase